MGGFEDKVRAVLSDTMSLPDDFLSMIPQYVAQNPVPLARVSGTRIGSGTKTSNVSTAGTTFATGVDVLAAPLTFTADGKTSYVVHVSAPQWLNNTAGSGPQLRLNLDGADAGFFAVFTSATANAAEPLSARGFITTPSAGSHTINARLLVNGGTGTIFPGAGGVGTATPIFVTLEVA